jgi:hypothetical protein
VKQENAVVLWMMAGLVIAAVALATALPWWLVPAGIFLLMLLSPLYIR